MFNVFAIAAAVLALAAPVGGPGQKSASQTSEYWYVANHDGVASAAVHPGIGPVAPRSIYAEPSGSKFTLNIDDFGTLDGRDVRIEIYGLGREFNECVPVRSTMTITGARTGAPPGKGILIHIGEGQGGPDFTHCSGIPTAGVMTLGGVRTL
jgi:hypothetical protein